MVDPWSATLCAALALSAGALASYALTAAERRRLRRLAGLLELAFRLEARWRDAARAARRLSRRPRRRYIVFEVVPAVPREEEVEHAIEDAIERIVGTVGLAASAFKVIEYNPRTGRGILRVRLGYKHAALAALGLVRRIGDRRVLVYPLTVTGSVKRARRAAGV